MSRVPSPLWWVAVLAALLLGMAVAAELLLPGPAPAAEQPVAPAQTRAARPEATPSAPASPDPSPPRPIPAAVTVEGLVVDGADGRGITGARVTASGESASALTDSGGRFTLGLRARTGVLRATAPGYESAEAAVPAPGAVAARITLKRTTLLRVLVQHGPGRPAAGARVDVTPPTPPRTATTDARGLVELTGIPADGYRVSARSEDGHAAAAGEVAVPAGQHAELVLTLGPAASVAGDVVEADGRPADGARVWVESADGSPLGSGGAAGNGVFLLEGLAVADQARVFAVLGGRQGRSELLALRAGRTTPGIHVVLAKGGLSIAGMVMDDDGVPTGGAQVELAPAWHGGEQSWASTTSDGDGRFEFGDLSEGRYDLTAKFGQQEAVLDDVKAGQRSVILQLASQAMVEGRVVDENGRPVPAFRVRVDFLRDTTPAGEAGRIRRGARRAADVNDPTGRFRLGPVSRGIYRLEAVDPAGRLGQVETQVFGRRSVDVGDVKLLGSGTVMGKVVDRRDGRPVPGAAVRADRAGEPATTGADGRFSVRIPPGPAVLWVEHPAYFAKRVIAGIVEVNGVLDAGELPLIGGTLREIEGRQGFGGVGATLKDEKGNVVVEGLIGDGPAARNGLQKGDVILAVDGQTMHGKGVQEAIANIRGETGSTVDLRIRRGGQELTVTIRREPINIEGR